MFGAGRSKTFRAAVLFGLLGLLGFLPGCDDSAPARAAPSKRGFQRIEDARLPKLFRLTGKLFSGAQPEGDEAFRALKERGVRTIISVDGARPDAARARTFGLRYVHLPIGYDGVPKERAWALAKALRVFPGKIYIHCHHGRHRGPAAAAAACVTAGAWNTEQALRFLEAAGTGKVYAGLWASVKNAKKIGAEVLEKLKPAYPEAAPVPPLAKAMVGIDHTLDNLKDAAKAAWRTPKTHPDMDPPHEALMLREHFTELGRRDAVQRKPADFLKRLREGEAAARALETALRAWKPAAGGVPPPPPPAAVGQIFLRVKAACRHCHARYRNVRPPAK